MGQFGCRTWSKPQIWTRFNCTDLARFLSHRHTFLQHSGLLLCRSYLHLFQKSRSFSGSEQRSDGWISGIPDDFFILCSRFCESWANFSPNDGFEYRTQPGGLHRRRLPWEHGLQKILHFLIFFILLVPFYSAQRTGSLRHPNPAYEEWIESYEGEFNQLKYTDITYRGDRRANAGREKLAPYSNGIEPGELTGNFLFQLGSEQTQGLEQDIALPETAQGSLSSNGVRFRPRGFQLRLAKRLFQFRNFSSHLDFTMRKSRAFLDRADGTILRTPSGERIDSLNGMQDNYFHNLDWIIRKPLAQKSRYDAELFGGVRFSDMSIQVNTTGTLANASLGELNSAKRDYTFRNLGIGPFLGFRANTPITNKVSTGVSVKQILLPSKGEASLSRLNEQAGGNIAVNETLIQSQSTAFPITELSWDLNFHFDQFKKLYVGYSYSHWNLYEIQGFGSENFRNLTMHGPRAALRFLF